MSVMKQKNNINMFLKNYRNILPKKNINDPNSLNDNKKLYTNSEIIKIIKQYEITIQLLIQIFLFSNNTTTKYKAYNKINSFLLAKNKVIFEIGIPSYDIFINDLKNDNTNIQTMKLYTNKIKDKSHPLTFFQMSPQFSIYQSAKLEIINLISESIKKKSIDLKFDLLFQLIPILDENWIIKKDYFLEKINVIDDKIKGKKLKFSLIQDHLLLWGLCTFGQQKFEEIGNFFLPEKQEFELKHRFKNLIKFSNTDNQIKLWKIKNICDLTFYEKINLEKALIWFGNKNINLIKNWFLPDRSIKYIDLYLNNNIKLIEKQNNSQYEFSKYEYCFFEKINLNYNIINKIDSKISSLENSLNNLKKRKFVKYEENNLNYNLSKNIAKIEIVNKNTKNFIILSNNYLFNSKVDIDYDKNINYKKISKNKIKSVKNYTNDIDNKFEKINLDYNPEKENSIFEMDDEQYHIVDGNIFQVLDFFK